MVIRSTSIDRCRRCKTHQWQCRSCPRRMCEHTCYDHDPETMQATCGKCLLQGRQRRP